MEVSYTHTVFPRQFTSKSKGFSPVEDFSTSKVSACFSGLVFSHLSFVCGDGAEGSKGGPQSCGIRLVSDSPFAL
jgi:hypothetical protein